MITERHFIGSDENLMTNVVFCSFITSALTSINFHFYSSFEQRKHLVFFQQMYLGGGGSHFCEVIENGGSQVYYFCLAWFSGVALLLNL